VLKLALTYQGLLLIW